MGGRRRGFESVAVVFVSNSKKWVLEKRGKEVKGRVMNPSNGTPLGYIDMLIHVFFAAVISL